MKTVDPHGGTMARARARARARALANEWGVRGYPTVQMHHRGQVTPFESPRTVEDLYAFMHRGYRGRSIAQRLLASGSS